MPKKKVTSIHHDHSFDGKELTHASELEKTLVKNLVELQKVQTDLAEKFDSLSKQISRLLALFETAALNFAKNAPMGEYEKDKEFLEKIDRLLDQNKTIAKGLTLMEERMRERVFGPTQEKEERQMQPSLAPQNQQSQQPKPPIQGGRPLPRF